MSEILLSCQNISLLKAGHSILSDLQFNVQYGTGLGLVGANGAGKSTLFKCIMGIEKLDNGSILWQNKDLIQQNMAQRRNLGLAYLAQEHWLFQDLDVISNLKAVCELLQLKIDLPKCEHLLEKVGLSQHLKQKAKTLSGGEKRRLEIARLLLENPKLIMLDEPFAGLDPKAIRLLKNLILELQSQGIATVISDHQVTHILEVCQNITLLHLGKILLECRAVDFSKHPLAKEIYL